MEIYLVRHGEYTDLGSRTLEEDSVNELSAVGIDKLRRQAQILAAWQLPIDRIVSSPFVRARQTADILAASLQMPIEEHVALTRTRFNVQGLQQLVHTYASSQHLMLVGHESDLSTVAAAITGGSQIELARGGIIRITLTSHEPLAGKLVWLLAPEIMLLPERGA
jgi:phosphohistidine phosphatase